MLINHLNNDCRQFGEARKINKICTYKKIKNIYLDEEEETPINHDSTIDYCLIELI